MKKQQEQTVEKKFDSMAQSIARYIDAIGGTAVVVGDVGIGQEPNALKHNYFIQVRITGKKPTKKNL